MKRGAEPLRPVERFWRYIIVGDGCGPCWEWAGARSESGYGGFWDGDRQLKAHRWAYEHFVGAVPDGLDLDHLCRNRACVNPAHLEPVTRRENVMRGLAYRPLRAYCVRNHELTPENTRVEANGYRRCRTCERDRVRERRRAVPQPGGLCGV